MVHTRGFEPPHRLALPPEDSVSTVPPRVHCAITVFKDKEIVNKTTKNYKRGLQESADCWGKEDKDWSHDAFAWQSKTE